MDATSKPWGVRPLVVCVGLWILGLAFDAWWGVALTVWLGLAGCGLVVWVGCWWWRKPGWGAGLLLAWFAVGGAWNAWSRLERVRQMGPSLSSWGGAVVWMEGWIASAVQRQVRPGQPVMQRAVFRPVRGAYALHRRWRAVDGQIWLKIRGGPQFVRGDWLRVRVRLRQPRIYANPGGFDALKYWQQRGIRWHASVRARDVLCLGQRSEGDWLRRWDQVRLRAVRWIQRHTAAPETAGLLCALLLGEKSGITATMRQHFARTGTAHMLAISGLHLAIVCSLLWWGWGWLFARWSFLLVRGWHRTWAAWCTLPGMLGYVLLSGGALSTQRALVMITLFVLARLLRRSRENANTLAVAGFLILLWQPDALFSLSFQLSFGAVIALVWGHRVWIRELEVDGETHTTPSARQKAGHWLLLSLWASAIATLSTLPLTLQFFPQLPLWGPVVNLLAVPLGGYLVVGLGLLAVGAWFCWPALAVYLLYLSEIAARLLLSWVAWCAQWPGSQFTIPPLQPHEWILYYMLLGSLLFWRQNRRVAVSLLAAAALLATGGWLTQHVMSRPLLEVHFLDVGQGDATLLRFPNGKVMLVDAGGAAFGQWDVGERVLLPTLRWMRISRIDYAVLSHPHPDHYGGFIAIAQHLSIGEFWHTGLHSRHPKFRQLMHILQRRKVRQRLFTKQHRRLVIDGVQVEVLHPFPGPYEGKHHYWVLHANNNSLVLRLTWGRVRLLLTGDIERRAEQILTERWPDLQADVLKVPHHGSRTSSTATLLDRVRPKHALFGVGRDNMFGFPHPEVLRRYRQRKIKMWRTDLHGRILVQTDGQHIEIETFLKVMK